MTKNIAIPDSVWEQFVGAVSAAINAGDNSPLNRAAVDIIMQREEPTEETVAIPARLWAYIDRAANTTKIQSEADYLTHLGREARAVVAELDGVTLTGFTS